MRSKGKREDVTAHTASPATMQEDVKSVAALAVRELLAQNLRLDEYHLGKLKLSLSADGRLFVFFQTKANEGPQFVANKKRGSFRPEDMSAFTTVGFELVDKNGRPALKEAFRLKWDIGQYDDYESKLEKFRAQSGLSGAKEGEIFFSRSPDKVNEMLKVYGNLTGRSFEKLDPMTLDSNATFPHGTYKIFSAVPKM